MPAQVGNVSQTQVGRLASSLRTLDVKSAVFRNNLVDALTELDRRSANPRVNAENILTGTISSGVTISVASLTGNITSSGSVTVNASAITGLISASQIGSVNTTSFVGSITSGQIASVNATSITGVVVSSQLADGIIDSLNKYNTTFRPIPTLASAPTLPDAEYPVNTFYYNTTDSKFYQNQSGTWTEVSEATATTGALTYYFVGKVNVGSFIGLITAAQIGSVNASTITGSITVASGVTIEAGTITGTITSGGPLSIEVGVLTGTISSSGSVVVNGNSIQSLTVPGTAIINGDITGAKIATATITNANIADLSVTKLTAGTATFSGTTRFGFSANNYIELTSTAMTIRSSVNEYMSATATAVTLDFGGNKATLNSSGITIQDAGGTYKAVIDSAKVELTGGSSGAKATFTTSGLTLTGEGASPSTATLTNTSLDFAKGTAHTVVSAGGVQIYGGTTGIGIGASTFASSPMKITSTSLDIAISGYNVGFSAGSNGIVMAGRGTSNEVTVQGELWVSGLFGGGDLKILGGGNGLYVAGNKVIGAQGAAVADATGAGDVVAQLNTLLSRLRTHGLIAT